ncbi:radical SAM protein [Geobacter pelophilus]|uniref:Radical SAM protein n=1 Tax=Geoanaerobacter pelophilus TaxID=60036 RepID=A0AAW4L2N6_9BACT|nr:radical SAM (seleno)protein TrsS [Geoanaerobacter pelophilus]MBT0665143.1 radical SAM protein [Geoanaerobacter pelophilus]
MTKPIDIDPQTTTSLCPSCLALIPAERRQEGDRLVLVKRCPDHGEFRALLWNGKPALAGWARPRQPYRQENCQTVTAKGCPFDCGICPGHRQQSCTVLLEVTGRCNLSCSVCFADSGSRAAHDPTIETIGGWYRRVQETSGPHNIIQLSGGEPTMRDDLPAIIALGRDLGFPFLQLNTNGVRLAAEPGYARMLKDSGLFSVFLQFDGTDDAIYRALRGRPLLAEKLGAIEQCAAAGLGVVLVPTLVPGINTGNVGSILQLALELGPAVRGVHFQPASFFGRYSAAPTDDERFTLPDLMRAIEEQTDGLIRTEHFRPPGCEHPRCSMHANFLRLPEGGLKPLTGHTPPGCCSSEPGDLGTGRAVSFVTRQWGAPYQEINAGEDSLEAFLETHRSNTLAVSAMAFQDVWNLDLERVQECCIHVAAPDGRLIPFCLYNLTSASGTPLYRRPSC